MSRWCLFGSHACYACAACNLADLRSRIFPCARRACYLADPLSCTWLCGRLCVICQKCSQVWLLLTLLAIPFWLICSCACCSSARCELGGSSALVHLALRARSAVLVVHLLGERCALIIRLICSRGICFLRARRTIYLLSRMLPCTRSVLLGRSAVVHFALREKACNLADLPS